MNCPFSGKPCPHARVFHITEISDKGEVSSLDLCHLCGNELLSDQYDDENSLIAKKPKRKNKKTKGQKKYIETPEELYELFGLDGPFGPNANNYVRLDTPNCPYCNISFDDLNFYGKVGCSHCYEHFHDELIATLLACHNSQTHVGKQPKALVKYKNKEELKELIKLAIKEERYEEAAEFKKQLDELNDSAS